MSKMRFAFWALVTAVPACFLSKEYKQSTFTYTRNGQAVVVPLLVPKGFTNEERIDTAGVIVHEFRYGDGAILYTAYLTDSTTELQPINKARHQPVRGPQDGLVYKGMDSNERFFREIRRGPFRFGYRNVSREEELKFDSATNYAAMQHTRL